MNGVVQLIIIGIHPGGADCADQVFGSGVQLTGMTFGQQLNVLSASRISFSCWKHALGILYFIDVSNDVRDVWSET